MIYLWPVNSFKVPYCNRCCMLCCSSSQILSALVVLHLPLNDGTLTCEHSDGLPQPQWCLVSTYPCLGLIIPLKTEKEKKCRLLAKYIETDSPI